MWGGGEFSGNTTHSQDTALGSGEPSPPTPCGPAAELGQIQPLERADHAVEREMPFGALARRAPKRARPFGPRHAGRGAPPPALSGRSGSTSTLVDPIPQLRNAADAGRDDGKARRHGLEDAVRARLGSRRQHEHVARRQQRRHVAALAEKLERAARGRAPAHAAPASSRSGPSPTNTNSVSGCSATTRGAAAMSVSWPFSSVDWPRSRCAAAAAAAPAPARTCRSRRRS